jgi:hypothetical protein
MRSYAYQEISRAHTERNAKLEYIQKSLHEDELRAPIYKTLS